MKNPFRSATSARGWWSLLWSDQIAAARLSAAISDVAQIPGCLVSNNSLQIPHTAWMLEEVQALAAQAGTAIVDTRRDLDFDGKLWKPLRDLYSYQKYGVEFALQEDGVLIADEMGVGKTAQAITIVETTRQRYGGPAIVLAPLSVRGTWQDELTKLGAITSPDQFFVLEGRKDVDGFEIHPRIRYYFVHFDIARSWWPKTLLLKAAGQSPCATIVDEAHLVRNSRTSRAKGALMFLSAARRKILLTGTPIDNRPSDLWFPLTLACGPRTWGSPGDFRRRYAGAHMNGFGGLQDGDTLTNVPELRARIASFYLRRTAEQVGLELPELTRRVEYCSLGKYEREHRDVIGNTSIEAIARAIAAGVVGEHLLPLISRLRQITSAAKAQATIDYVNNALEQGESLVVFCWERQTAAKIAGAIVHRVECITGDVDQKIREHRIRWFQAEAPEPRCLVATLGSLSVGVTLHRARIVVMHDLDWLVRDLLQAEKRIHRIGQKRACQSIWMLAENSIDTIMAPILLRKAELMQDFLGMSAGVELAQDLGLEQLAGREAVEEQVDRALRVWGKR